MVKNFIKMAYSLKKSMTSLSIFILSYIGEYFFNVILAKNMTAKDYGDISIIFKLAELLIPFVLLGFNGSLTKILPPLLGQEKKEESSRFISALFYVLFSRLLLVFCISCTGIFIIFIMDTTILAKQKFHYPLVSAFFLVPFLAIILIFNKIMICHKKYFSAIILSHIVRHVLGAIVVFEIFISIEQITFYTIFEAILFSYFIVIILQSFYVIPIVKDNYLSMKSKCLEKEWISLSHVYMFNDFARMFLSGIDLVLLNILGSKNTTAYFKALLVISTFLLVIIRASSSFFSPKISELFHKKKFKKLQKSINKIFLFDLMALLFSFIIIMVNSKALLGYFGREYQNLSSDLLFMIIGVFVYCLNISLARLLVYTNSYRINLKLNVISIIFAIIGDFIFIPIFDLKGAILVFSLTNFMQLFVRLCLIKKQLPIKPFIII